MTSANRINKRAFINWIACPTFAWNSKNRPSAALSEIEKRRIDDGQEIGLRSRKLYLSGVLIEEKDFEQAVARSNSLIEKGEAEILFECAFFSPPFAARSDILVRGDNGWDLYEVKSSTHKEDKVEPEHIQDLAYTTMVLRRSGLEVRRTFLLRISKDWRLGMDDTLLFRQMDCTDSVNSVARTFEEICDRVAVDLLGARSPEPRLKKICGKCDDFFNTCLGAGKTRTIFEIPRLSDKKFTELTAAGALELKDIPAGTAFTDIQSRIVLAARNNEEVINRTALASLLETIRWPAYYLDFETVSSAIPFWYGVGPHEQVLTQYSIHVCNQPGEVVRHCEYLADASRDARDQLVTTLLNDLGHDGSIIVYSNFESTQLKRLSELFPAYAPRIDAVLDRLVDLEEAFKEGYYHPNFGGRTSIKATLPALIPEMSYEHLPIGNGEMAVAVFAALAKGALEDLEAEKARKNLLEYCCQDTLAMVKIHEQLCNLVSSGT